MIDNQEVYEELIRTNVFLIERGVRDCGLVEVPKGFSFDNLNEKIFHNSPVRYNLFIQDKDDMDDVLLTKYDWQYDVYSVLDYFYHVSYPKTVYHAIFGMLMGYSGEQINAFIKEDNKKR